VEVEVGAEVVAPRRRKSLGLLVWVLRSKVAAGFYSNELKKKKKLKPNSRSRCLEVEVKIRQANMAPKRPRAIAFRRRVGVASRVAAGFAFAELLQHKMPKKKYETSV